MAKVVLVWNEHPTEVIAGYHARKVAEILKEKYGHEVIVEKIPARKTNYGIVSKVSSTADAETALDKLSKLKPSFTRGREFSKKHGAATFNFHCSRSIGMGQARQKPLKKFKVGFENPREHKIGGFLHEITFIGNPQENHFVVEIPAKTQELPERIRQQKRMQIKEIRKQNRVAEEVGYRTPPERIIWETKDSYQLESMGLKAKGQRKYLSPIISEKIAAAIHERLTR